MLRFFIFSIPGNSVAACLLYLYMSRVETRYNVPQHVMMSPTFFIDETCVRAANEHQYFLFV